MAVFLYWPITAVPVFVQSVCGARSQQRHRTGDAAHLVIGQREAGQRHIARVGDAIGPRHRRAYGHHRAGRRVGVLAVGVLRQLDLRIRAIVVARVGVCHRRHRSQRRRTRHHRGVGILADLGHARFGAEGRGARGQQRHRTGDAPFPVVHQHNVCQRHVARVGDAVGPRHRRPHLDVGAGRRVRIFTVGVLGHLDGRLGGEVVARVGVGHRCGRTHRRCTRHDGRVLVLADDCRARLRAERCCARSQQRHRTGDAAHLVIGQREAGQRHIARVGDAIGPRHCRAYGHHRAGRRVGVLAVGVLRQLDLRIRAIVVARVGVRHRRHRSQRRRTRHHRGVGILADLGHARFGAEGRGARGQQRHRTGDAPFPVVHQHNVGQRHVARVGDAVGPRHRRPHLDVGAGRRVRILAVGVLGHLDGRLGGKVVARVGVRHRCGRTHRRCTRHDGRFLYWPMCRARLRAERCAPGASSVTGQVIGRRSVRLVSVPVLVMR
jgi:hypothetical protein